MMKRILCAVLCLLLAVAVPALAEEDKDARIAELEAQVAELEAQVAAYHLKELAATFDGGEVPLEDAKELYAQYESVYAQYGIDLAAYGMEDMMREQVVTALAEDAIIQYMAGQLGLGLTADQEAQFAQEATQSYESNVNMYYQNYLQAQYEDETEGIAAAAQALNDQGYTYEYVLENLEKTQLSDNVYQYITGDVSVSDEEVQSSYDELVAADEANYGQSVYQFESAFSDGSTIYYTPEGYRNVKHILFKFDDEQAAAYEELTARLEELETEQIAAAEADEAAQQAGETDQESADAAEETAETVRPASEIAADIEEVNAQIDALYMELMPEAEAAIERFNSGEDISALIAELNEDTGMPETGYAVSETAEVSSQAWDPAFTEGALSIEEVGGLSEPVRGMYGVHLIYYAGDLTPGATPLDDVREIVKDYALQNKINQTYTDQLAAWKEELNLVIYPEHLA